MIATLRVGMKVLLPSGNTLVLVRRDRSFWVCAYTPNSTQRGEVELSGVYLRRWGRAV